MRSEDVTKLPYAPWLENAIKVLSEHSVKSACIVANIESGDTLTGYWKANARDKAIFASNIQSDIVIDTIYGNASLIRQILEDAGDEEDVDYE